MALKLLNAILRMRDFSNPLGMTRTRFTLLSRTYRAALAAGSTLVILNLPLSSRVFTDFIEVLVWSRSWTQRWKPMLSSLMKIVPNTRIRIIGKARVKNIAVFSR